MKNILASNRFRLNILILICLIFSTYASYSQTDTIYIASKAHRWRYLIKDSVQVKNIRLTDTLTGIKALKTVTYNIRKGIEYFLVDSLHLFKYSPIMPDNFRQEKPFFESDDSTICYIQDSIYLFPSQIVEDPFRISGYIEEMRYDATEFNSYIYTGFKVFTLKSIRIGKYLEVDTISKIDFKQLTMQEMRSFPVRKLVEARLKKLGTHTKAFRDEASRPFNYREILDSVMRVQGDGLKYLKERPEEPFDMHAAVADVILCRLLIYYYNMYIKNGTIREEVLRSLQQLENNRIKEITEATKFCCSICKLPKEKWPANHKKHILPAPPIDLRKDRNFQNIVQFKNVKYEDPTKIDSTKFFNLFTLTEFPLNPKGIVTVQFYQVFVDSLYALMKNIDYDVRKIYGIKRD